MPDLPAGTVTFLFTDIEGSTALWGRDQLAMEEAVAHHLDLLRVAIETQGGARFKTVGDGTQSAFPAAKNALAAAIAAQRALLAASWSDPPGPLRVRMALHAGEAYPQDGDYLAAPLNRLARLLATGHGSQILLTQTVQQLVRDDSPADAILRPLGTHRLRDLDEPEAVFQAVASGLPETFPPLRSLPNRLTNLVAPPTDLIGRESEIAAVMRRFDEGVRLVTLTGPGGTGKTRLAQEIGTEALAQYPDGVFFVDLSPLRDAALVLPTVAAALGVREIPGQTLRESLVAHLAPKRLLLVLDNCEQVVDAAPEIAALLAACSHLAVLATSREPLHVRAERAFPLLPLPLPEADRVPRIEDIAGVAAVALFVERASASQPDFALTEDNAAAVAAICRRLDGLPLAIELAATRIKAMPPAALLARLEQRLPVLTGGSRDLPARQRTMRDTIAWSYDLLSPEEQALFRRLAVFPGGFTLAAAEAVAEQDGGPTVLDGIVALLKQSLLRQTPGSGDEPRYQLLETVREFGLEQLAAVGERDEARQRHADYFRQIAEKRHDRLGMIEGMADFVAERDNVLLALTWFDERDDAEALLRLSVLLYGIWFAPGLSREGLQWLERALHRSRPVASAPRVLALTAAASLELFQGDYARAATFSAEGLVMARQLRDPMLVGGALHIAGLIAYRRGEYARAEDHLDEAHRLLSDLRDTVPEAVRDLGHTLLVLGDTALAQEQFDRAATRYQQSLERFRVGHYLWGPIDAQIGLASVAYCSGDLAQAVALFADNLDRAQNRGLPLLVASALFGMAGVAADTGLPEAGAHLLGAAEGMWASRGAPIFPRDRPVRERSLAVLTAALGEDRLAAARGVGRGLSLDQALKEARTVADAVTASLVGMGVRAGPPVQTK